MCRGRSFTNGGEDGNTGPGSNSRNITVVTRVWVEKCVPNITFGSQSLCPAMTALFWHYLVQDQDTSLRKSLLLPNKSLQNFNNYSHRVIIARRVVTTAVSLLLTGWSLRCSVRAGMVTLYMCTLLYTTLLQCTVCTELSRTPVAATGGPRPRWIKAKYRARGSPKCRPPGVQIVGLQSNRLFLPDQPPTAA